MWRDIAACFFVNRIILLLTLTEQDQTAWRLSSIRQMSLEIRMAAWGDGTIARGVGTQYTAGWDWIQPIRDHNTGIWDKVSIETTGDASIENPHIVTLVPGIRKPTGPQEDAIIKVSAELSNTAPKDVEGTLVFNIGGAILKKHVKINPRSTTTAYLSPLPLKNPRLRWPNGYGEEYLYFSKLEFTSGSNRISDSEAVMTESEKFRQPSMNTRVVGRFQ